MLIKINNYKHNDILNISLPLLDGEVTVSGDSKIFVTNSSRSSTVIWPVVNGKFKALVHLKCGVNKIKLVHKNTALDFNLICEPLNFKRFVRLVYIKCKDDEGFFQAPPEEDNSVNSACKRIKLGAQMIQTFTYDKLEEHNLGKKAFSLEEINDEVVCHIFTSSLKLCDAFNLNENELWSHFAVELMNSDLRVGNDCKFLAFLSFTRYRNNSNMPPQNHREILGFTKGQAAIGGGGLALFGSGCLHTWPQNLQEVPWRFGDKRDVDRMKFMDDSANRGWYWACYSTTLGATLHELGHTFDLGHTKGGIMGRGFDDIYKYFIVDLFYFNHTFQKQHNPYYKESTAYNHSFSLSLASSVSLKSTLNVSLNDLHLSHSDTIPVSWEAANNNSVVSAIDSNFTNPNSSEVAWKVPNPPEKCCGDSAFAVNVGKAYWERSSALILYYHKWFNDADTQNEVAISLKDSVLFSPHGISVVEFRDTDGTAHHHLEFFEEKDNTSVNLSLYNIIQHVPQGTKEISFIAEDKMGNILKSKLHIDQLQGDNTST